MRASALVLSFLVACTPAFATRTVSVAQLERQIATLHGKADDEFARFLGDLQLSERITPAQLTQIQSQAPGEKSRLVLLAIADQAEFLAPADPPTGPAPDFAEQRRIMGLAVAYVSKAIPQLPNFVASRVTTRFEDTPLIQTAQESFVPYEPIHPIGAETAVVNYDNGRETVQLRAKTHGSEGLQTWGAFGPILGTVLVDAAQSKLNWARWEEGPDGVRAVFAHAVPREKSHYEVDYCCVAAQAAAAAAIVHPFRKTIAYHGEIAVDPATGVIRRLVLNAELKSDDPIVKADILVDYGPVEIAGRTYTCPLRSISRSQAQGVQVDPVYHYALANQVQPLKNSLNDVRFTDYHVFRGETRVLAEASPPSPGESAPTPPAESPSATSPAPQTPPAAADASAPAGSIAAGFNPPPTPAANPPAPPPAAVEQPARPEVTETADASLPDTPIAAQSATGTGFTLRSISRLVDVAVVAFDKKGRPVTNLKPGDLEIYDNGRKQQVSFFTQAGAGVETSSPAAPAPPAPAEEAQVPNSVVSAPAHADNGVVSQTVLLIDPSNVAFADLDYARGEMLRFLKTVPADERVGLYILHGHGFDVLEEPIADHTRIAAALAKLTPTAQDLLRAQEMEDRNRQHIDSVLHAEDLAYVNGNGEGGSDPSMYVAGVSGNPQMMQMFSHPPDAKLRTMGSNPERDVLYLLQGVGRHLAGLPGHKTLVWVASDNVLADWSSSVASHDEKGSKYIDTLAIHTRETLNEAHVSIYPLDVSQLEAGGIDADLGRRNVGVFDKSDRDPSFAGLGDIAPGMKAGREAARMKADTHPIQPTFRELAAATGGRTFRRSGEIAAELNQIVADGRAAYLLAFHPDAQPDDQYHVLTVKSTQPGLTLRYRTGYLYTKEPATMKDRIHQAIWDARDATDIGLRAQVVGNSAHKTVELSVAATDVALAQHADRWTDKLHVLLVVRNDSDLHAKVSGRTLQLELKPATYQRALNEGIAINQPIPAPQQSESVRVLVIDENSGRIGAVTIRQ